MRAAAVSGLDRCVHCGFCLESCPTYRVTRDEADSPRGRIVLMQALAVRSRLATDRTLTLHLDRCLGCRACEPVCPSGVEYGSALEVARHALAAHRPIPASVRALHAVLAEPIVGRPVFAVARVVRPLAGLLAGRSRIGMAFGMLAATTPWRPPEAAAKPQVRAEVKHPTRRSPVLLFRGCVMDELFRHVHDATVRVLAANGFPVIEPDEHVCCGALHAHAGQRDEAMRLTNRNQALLSRGGRDVLIAVNAAGCSAMLKDSVRYVDSMGGVTGRVRDVTELLASAGPRRGGSLPLRVAYDPPCHLLHAQGIVDAPEAVLDAIPGIERVHHDDAELCCGSAGSYTFAQPEVSRAVLELKVHAIRAAAPDVVVSGNPGCIMQIGAGLRAAGIPVPVVHPIELLDWSYERAGFYTD